VGTATAGTIDDSHTYADDGTYTVTVTVSDDDGGSATQSFAVVVANVAPAVAVDVSNQSVQYSDSVQMITVSATDVPADVMNAGVSYSTDGGETFTPGLPDAGSVATGLVFTGAVDQVASGSWTLSGIGDLAPGSYVFKFDVSDEDGGTGSAISTVVVEQEDAVATYSGSLFVSTPSVNTNEATIELRATIQDITAVPADPDYDPQSGNITYASVSFIDVTNGHDPANPVVIATGVPALLDPSDLTVGIAAYSWTIDIGNSDSETFQVAVQVDGYYTDNTSASDFELITVSKPLNNAVTGGGYIINESSGGSFAGDVGLRTNYGFNIKTNKKGTNVQGQVNIVIRQADRILQIKTNATDSLVALPVDADNPAIAFAEFAAKANLRDITDPLNPISLGGNLQLIATVTDAGEPGTLDMVGFTVWDGSSLLYSSNWSGTITNEQLIAGGNIQVRLKAPNNVLLATDTGMPTGDAPDITRQQLDSAAEQVIDIYADSYATFHEVSHLADVELRIEDLPDDQLGAYFGDVIWVDLDAAGFGWSVDGLSGVDLISVLAHEFGHVLGLGHDVMGERLGLANRNLDWLHDPRDASDYLEHDREADTDRALAAAFGGLKRKIYLESGIETEWATPPLRSPRKLVGDFQKPRHEEVLRVSPAPAAEEETDKELTAQEGPLSESAIDLIFSDFDQ
jgi:hypothetical protein